MTPRERDEARAELRRRRAAILEATRQAGDEHDGLLDAEHGHELEEVAQAEQGLNDLERLGAAERQELARIDAALSRIEQGGYGVCAGCGSVIERRRLDALPWALRCTSCETALEGARR